MTRPEIEARGAKLLKQRDRLLFALDKGDKDVEQPLKKVQRRIRLLDQQAATVMGDAQ